MRSLIASFQEAATSTHTPARHPSSAPVPRVRAEPTVLEAVGLCWRAWKQHGLTLATRLDDLDDLSRLRLVVYRIIATTNMIFGKYNDDIVVSNDKITVGGTWSLLLHLDAHTLLKDDLPVIVIGATSSLSSIDGSLLRCCDQELERGGGPTRRGASRSSGSTLAS
jgi:hypothetical protein